MTFGDKGSVGRTSNLRRASTAAVAVVVAVAIVFAFFTRDPSGSNLQPKQQIVVAIRRLSESQYRHTIADVFGPDIEINARFEPETREGGLLAIGTALLSLTSAGFEQYFALASSISDQALSETRRDQFVSCNPADDTIADDACTREVIANFGRLLFRRPLTDGEIAARLATASAGASDSDDFYAGLQLALTSLLVAPEFLFRIETIEPDPESRGQYRLDAYSKASRISFLFWDAAPDEELLDAARSGAIHTEAGLDQQLARMTASPRYEQGARAFLEDMLQLDGFENLVKDPAIYPKFNQTIADAAKEQTLRTAIDLLFDKQVDYRDIFTSNFTYINRALASVYNVPYLSKESWTEHTFTPESERSGILTQVSFLSLFAHPGTSSPTRRGIKVHEIFMCEPTPDPPADVDFSNVKDSTEGTVRGRLLDHMSNPGCSGCHLRTDPPGLALEHFDGLGQLRTLENGVPIDVSVDLLGTKLVGATGLANYLRNDPRVPACLVRNVYTYGIGRTNGPGDRPFLESRTREFVNDGYKVPGLMVRIASSPEFFSFEMPEEL